jgi:hypothetical protein
MSQGHHMRIFVCLGFLLAASAADAQTYNTTVNPATNTVTTTGNGYTATTTRSSNSSSGTTYTTTVTRTGGYQPMGSGGYNPMGH